MRKTLEDFLQDQCGMATRWLVEYYEPHREFVENKLAGFSSSNEDEWEEFAEQVWLFLPDLPDGWKVSE